MLDRDRLKKLITARKVVVKSFLPTVLDNTRFDFTELLNRAEDDDLIDKILVPLEEEDAHYDDVNLVDRYLFILAQKSVL